jgi:hypothetical protein
MINSVSILSTLVMTAAITADAGTIGLTFTGGSNTTTAFNSTHGWAFTPHVGISGVPPPEAASEERGDFRRSRLRETAPGFPNVARSTIAHSTPGDPCAVATDRFHL